MKQFIFSLSVFVLIITLVILDTIMANSLCGKYLKALQNSPHAEEGESMEEAHEYFHDLKEKWSKDKDLITLSVNHEKITEMDQNIASIMGACDCNDITLYTVYVKRTEDTLEYLKGLSKISIGNII